MRMTRRFSKSVWLLALMLSMTSLTACGAARYDAEPASFEGKVAVKGSEAVSYGNIALTGIEGLVESGVLPKAEAVKVLDAFAVVGVGLKELHGVLVIIDQEQAATGPNHQKAFEIARRLIAQLAVVPLPAGADAARVKIAAILEQVRSALVNIVATLNPPQARLEWEVSWKLS